MNYSLQQQRGMTMISLVLLLAAIGAVVILVLKITPVYMNHGKVVSALEGLKGTTDIQTQSKAEVITSLSKRFTVNSVTGIDSEKDIIITKNGDYLKVEIKYQVEQPLVGNLFALMKFDDVIEVGKP
jgi:hypothetical protein